MSVWFYVFIVILWWYFGLGCVMFGVFSGSSFLIEKLSVMYVVWFVYMIVLVCVLCSSM